MLARDVFVSADVIYISGHDSIIAVYYGLLLYRQPPTHADTTAGCFLFTGLSSVSFSTTFNKLYLSEKCEQFQPSTPGFIPAV